jgi:hypothetical protein
MSCPSVLSLFPFLTQKLPPLVPTFPFTVLYIYYPPTSLSYFPVNILASPCALFFRLQPPSWSQEIFFHMCASPHVPPLTSIGTQCIFIPVSRVGEGMFRFA